MKSFLKNLFFIVIICVLLTGCGSTATNTPKKIEKITTDPDELIISESERGVSKNIEIIPYDNLIYNDETFSLKSIDFYQEQSESGFGYYPYVVVQFDFSSLCEDSIYWMMKKTGSFGIRTFGVDAYITSEQNNIDFERMTLLNATYNNESATYIFFILEEYKYDFSDMKLNISVDVMQDETYDYNDGKLNKHNDYTWIINKNNSKLQIPIQNFSDIPIDIMNYIQSGYIDHYFN